MVEAVKNGIYKHFKGETYMVVGTATNTETEEQLIIYRKAFDMHADLWARPVSNFKEMVNGVPRFKYMG